MTLVLNGDRKPLVIQDVFTGMCGVSKGRVAFTPDRPDLQPAEMYGALLDGAPVLLVDVTVAEDGRSIDAGVRYLTPVRR